MALNISLKESTSKFWLYFLKSILASFYCNSPFIYSVNYWYSSFDSISIIILPIFSIFLRSKKILASFRLRSSQTKRIFKEVSCSKFPEMQGKKCGTMRLKSKIPKILPSNRLKLYLNIGRLSRIIISLVSKGDD